jgi:3-hydroxyisobutyrate dehydrogenase
MSAERPRIAVLGGGNLAAPFALELLEAQFPITVWGSTASDTRVLAHAGAVVAGSSFAAVDSADAVFTLGHDGAATAEALDGLNGGGRALRPGMLWLQLGTVGASWTQHFAGFADSHGLTFIDAPAMRAGGDAAEPRFLLLASGSDAGLKRAEPIFDALAARTLRLGPVGNGTKVKLALDSWLATQVEALAEGVALSGSLGIDPRLFLDTMSAASLGSPYAALDGQAILTGNFELGFSLRDVLNGADLALTAARGRGAELPLTAALTARWQEDIAELHADDDVSSLIADARRGRRALTNGHR